MATGTSALKEATTNVPTKRPTDFPSMLTTWLPEIKRALPKHINGDRMSRIALTAFRRNPKLGECDPLSVFAAVIQAAQLGLEPDTLGRSYLIPYANRKKVGQRWESVMECQFVPGWKGLVDLMNRSGQGTVYTGVIFSDQEYSFTDGSVRELKIHNETSLVDPGDITHAFAVGHIKGGIFPVIELWRMAKVIKHRDRYNKVGEKHYSFGNMEMYARKVVLLQVLKYMPCSPELAAAMALNDAAEIGNQNLTVKEAIEGSWESVPQSEEDESGAPDTATTSTAPGAATDAAKAGPVGGVARPKPSDATYTVLDAIADIETYSDLDKLAEWADIIPGPMKADDRFSKAYKARMDAIKGKS